MTAAPATIEAPARKSIRLGTDLSGVTNVDEALVKAGLNWGLKIVDASALTVLTDDGVISTSIPGQRLVVRDDNLVTLGVVGGRYTPVDNHSVFGLAEHILSQGGTFASGGALDHGRSTFMRFDLPGTEVTLDGGKDLVKFGVVIKAKHDGTGNVTAALEGTRLICTNGMTATIKGIPHVFSVRHTASAETRMVEAQHILQGANRYAKEFAAVASHLLDTPMTPVQFKRYIDRLFPEPTVEEKRAHTLWENRRSELLGLFRFAETNNLVRGTAWAGYNSVTEYLDWTAPVRTGSDATVAEVRVRRQFETSNQVVKDQAFAALASR